MIKRIGVLTSGGDAPGMNAAIRAVTRKGIRTGMEVYGIGHGYKGLIEGDMKLMNIAHVGDIIHRGGTVLKTARCEEFKTDKGIDKAVENINKAKLDSIIAIGGDGTLKGALELVKRGINVQFIPATIDNDLGYCAYSIGFDTAVNTVVNAANGIRETGMSHDKTTIIEVMGRNCGDIALMSGLAGGADAVLIPEVKSDINKIIDKIKEGISRKKKNSIIIRAEGADISTEELTEEIKMGIGEDVRTVILGYLQRGGSPTALDRNMATLMGSEAVRLISEDKPSTAIGFDGQNVTLVDLKKADNIENKVRADLLELVMTLA